MDNLKFEIGDFDFGDLFENYTISYGPSIDSDTSPCTSVVNESINTALAVIYSLVCFLAVTGNIIVMIVLLYNRRTISSTDIYLLHLAVADLLFAVTLPFWAVDAVSGWVFGDAMCKIISMLQKVNFYSGFLFLACISIDHYLATIYSKQTYRWNRPFLACIAVWLLAILLSIPVLHKGEYTLPNSNRKVCYILDGKLTETWKMNIRFLHHFIDFLIALVVIIFCFDVSILKLYQTKGRQKHKAMNVITVVVLAFVICWLPYNVTMFIDILMRTKLIAETCEKRNHIDRALVGNQSLGFLHSCVNPFIYAFLWVKFRKNLINLLAMK
ncbi:C-X-C chemokine receptor type 2-like [Chiloscyllium plagiosum]|uniref:C-X-C chemokine receptor type 2-like n=1 Tax=Chiloscyllium plagiosum TaxID=36176 RepID=UPI001CB7CF2E|nr:C-X-C chemokine receptor type 2-like [Chiloscyllium plagiosum]XP_043550319.1 C-X-C chemokine receptor type 2-like [Chiloscyllium plagiosum]XP_043550320.1 C-X-C chemokine receptor type 2-like [Chiloscyllium plagiosum]XP_043550321.1 C-X-C chemokine receptor type 2-like [Chiloscyllium plagiosum]XP_043550322.1 C-X-C chemokine receptor type 2-like [Chiloscyllium plagiosum]